MADYRYCKECGKSLGTDDIAIHRKLINRAADTFFCIDCLASKFGCTRTDVERLIEYYRSCGNCTLFCK